MHLEQHLAAPSWPQASQTFGIAKFAHAEERIHVQF
jgi:hypothetical protein